MRFAILTTLLAVVTTTVLAEDLASRPVVDLFGDRYEHVLTESGNDDAVSHLYVKQGESPETWTRQFGVCHWPKVTDFAQIVGPTVRDLQPQFVRDAEIFSPEGARHDLETMVEVFLKSRQDGYLEHRLLRFVKEENVPGIKLYVLTERFHATPAEGFPIDPDTRIARMTALTEVRMAASLPNQLSQLPSATP